MNNLDALLIIRNCALASPSLQTKQGKTALSVVDRKIQSLLRKKAWRDSNPFGTPVHMGDPDFKYPLPDLRDVLASQTESATKLNAALPSQEQTKDTT